MANSPIETRRLEDAYEPHLDDGLHAMERVKSILNRDSYDSGYTQEGHEANDVKSFFSKIKAQIYSDMLIKEKNVSKNTEGQIEPPDADAFLRDNRKYIEKYGDPDDQSHPDWAAEDTVFPSPLEELYQEQSSRVKPTRAVFLREQEAGQAQIEQWKTKLKHLPKAHGCPCRGTIECKDCAKINLQLFKGKSLHSDSKIYRHVMQNFENPEGDGCDTDSESEYINGDADRSPTSRASGFEPDKDQRPWNGGPRVAKKQHNHKAHTENQEDKVAAAKGSRLIKRRDGEDQRGGKKTRKGPHQNERKAKRRRQAIKKEGYRSEESTT